MTSKTTAPLGDLGLRGLSLLCPDHLRRVATLCRRLLDCATANDGRALVIEWNALEAALLDHMDAEEEVILPAYAQHAPEDARQIRADHERLRALLAPIGIEVELHEIRIARLRALVGVLEAHALDEDIGMYPWAEHNLPRLHRLLFARVNRSLERC